MTTTNTSDADKALTMMLKVSPLTAPGSESNWLDWSYLVQNGLSLAKLDHHILEDRDPKSRPPTWKKDNQRILVLLGSIVNQSNTRYIREGGDNAFAAWRNLRAAHKDETAGGRMFWLRKIILSRMEEDDIDKHIDSLLSSFDKLESLVSIKNPLTLDNILTTALFISLPLEWTPVVAPLMQQSSVTSTNVIRALHSESSQLHEQSEVSAAKVSTQTTERKHCTHCDRDGHTLLECYTAAGILKRHKQDFKRDKTRGRHQTASNKTKAGKTSIVTLGDKSDESDEDSGNDTRTTARAARLDSTTALSGRSKSTDWFIDSGCGRVMSPHKSHVLNKGPPSRQFNHCSLKLRLCLYTLQDLRTHTGTTSASTSRTSTLGSRCMQQRC